ncbi:MAG: hypothetical protein ACPLYX_12110 [Rectinema subterraneum]|uniref:hypothetical protein n=1 Tax=Rectinema subterraneum TaxID=2653714 RepID=UPI003C7DE333
MQYCQEYGIGLSGPKLGRPFKESEKNREKLREIQSIAREDERARIAVEGKFGKDKSGSHWLLEREKRVIQETHPILPA